jgi:RNA polymerase-binding protein DksA
MVNAGAGPSFDSHQKPGSRAELNRSLVSSRRIPREVFVTTPIPVEEERPLSSNERREIAVVETSALRSRLESQLAELEKRQLNVAEDLSQPLDADFAEQAVEMEDDAGLEAQAALISRQIASVKRALSRLDDGTYGECVRCGAEIAEARLEARPEAALCIDCARLNDEATQR